MKQLERNLRGVALGYLLDQLLGELPDSLHPLRAFGDLMAAVQRLVFAHKRGSGAGYALFGAGTGLLVGFAVPSVAIASYFSTGSRALGKAATTVEDALAAGDLLAAREHLRALVGRETEGLDEAGISRAVVESVAENTNDGVIAPLMFGALGGAPGTLCYRAANTLDSMVGYRNQTYREFGWASARLDDVLSFLPARATAVLVVLVRPWRTREVIRVVRRDARSHPSPNAGVVEAAFAGALGLRLGGANAYSGEVEQRPTLGDGRPAGPGDISRAVRLSTDVGRAAAAGAGLVSLWLSWKVWGRRQRGAPAGKEKT